MPMKDLAVVQNGGKRWSREQQRSIWGGHRSRYAQSEDMRMYYDLRYGTKLVTRTNYSLRYGMNTKIFVEVLRSIGRPP